jgi:hypothetical protein
MRHIGGDVEKVSGSCDEMLFEFLAAPHAGFTAEDLEGGLVTVVLMRFGYSTGWDPDYLQMDSLRAYGLRGNRGCTQMPLLTHEFRRRADDARRRAPYGGARERFRGPLLKISNRLLQPNPTPPSWGRITPWFRLRCAWR